MMESHLHRQYRLTLWKYRKFRQRLDRRLNNNTLSELSVRHRNRLFRTIERLRRRLTALENRLKYAAAGMLTAAALASSMPAVAQQPNPVGPEFRINSYTTSFQRNPSVAMDSDGDFVVTWISNGQDGSGYGIYAQRYDASGVPQGSEFRVNTFTTGYQSRPSVAMDSDGDFVVAWHSNGQDGSNIGIYAQRYNASGVAQGSEFRVNTYTTSGQTSPSVAMDSDGDFVVVWESYQQDGSSNGIYAQRYNASGVEQGSEFHVNTYTTGMQSDPSVAMDSDGDFVVIWTSRGQDGSDDGIYAQRYNASGVAQGSEFRVNTYTTGSQYFPSIAMDSDGDFVVTWESADQNGTGAQRYNASGVPQGSEFLVNAYTTGYQFVSSVAMDSDGDFVVTWVSSGQDGSSYGIYAQQYTASGAAQGSEFRVNAYTTGSQYSPSVAMDSDGDFIVTWWSYGQDGDNWGIYAQRFVIPEPPPTPLGEEFRVNTYTTSSQQNSSIAMDAAGNYVVAWESSGQDGDGSGIYAQRYNAAGVAQGSEFLINTYTAGNQSFPSVAMDSDGDFVVTWSSVQDGSLNGIYAQRYNASGVLQGSEFRVNTYTTGNQLLPSVAMDSDGDFVVTWQSGQDGDGNGIYAQRYNAEGVAQGIEFRVNTHTTFNQQHSSSAMDADGNYVIAWTSYGQDGDGSGIYAQRYNAAGVAQGGEFRVNTYTTSYQFYPSVAMDSDGDFVVTWTSAIQDGSNYGIYAQRYNASGVTQGGEFRVNTYTTGSQFLPSVAIDSDGDFVIAWTSQGQDGSSDGIYAQRYDASGVPRGSEFRVNTYTTDSQGGPSIAIDSEGDFIVTWQSNGQDGSGIYAQRYQSANPNLPPVLAVNAGLTLDEGGSAHITSALLQSTDANDSADEIIYELTALPQNGTLSKDGLVLNPNDTFTQQDIDDDYISYEHNGSETTSDAFSFTVSDGNTTLSEAVFSITVNPVSDAPVLQTNAGLTLNEGANSIVTSALLNTTDVDNTNTQIIYQVTALPSNGILLKNSVALAVNEQFTQADVNNSLVSYQHDGSETTSDAFSFTVTDGTATLPAATFNITVTPVNDAPILQTNAGLTLNEGANGVVTSVLLNTTDVDNTNAQITYKVTALPSNGILLKNSVVLALNEQFTQADVNNSLVSYQHDGSETTSDVFSFTVTDGTATLPAASFAITVTPVNDAPVLQTNAGLTVDQGASGVIGTSRLNSTDVDNTNAQIIYTLTSLPANGILSKNGTGLNVNDAFTQADINNELVSYQHDDSETTSDSFTFTVSDGVAALAAATFTITINPAEDIELLDQAITFNTIPDKTQGDAPFTLTATASSGLPVVYIIVSGPATISGNTVTLTGAGKITIRASQAGNDVYNPAESEEITFCSNPPRPTISIQGVHIENPTLISSADTGNQWYRGANVIAGATGKSLAATDPGIYRVEVTIGGCTSALSTDFALVITGLPRAEEIVLHPNPVQDVVRVQGLTDKVIALHILDGSGRSQQVSFAQEAGGVSVNVEHLAPGAYLMNVSLETKYYRMRFIKE